MPVLKFKLSKESPPWQAQADLIFAGHTTTTAKSFSSFCACGQVRVATRELGGFRAINCKSGKDRTAMEIAISFTQVGALAREHRMECHRLAAQKSWCVGEEATKCSCVWKEGEGSRLWLACWARTCRSNV